MTIAIDTMGGDLGYAAVIEGVDRARKEFPFIEPVLFGNKEILSKETDMKIIHAPTVIETNESPTLAFRRKKDASVVMGLKYVKEGNAVGLVSAGSTGALLTGATVIIGRKPGIERPALGTLLPTRTKHVLLLDCGANMDCKPSYLAQFAQLGTEYAQKCMGIANPAVALINVGTEEEKGNSAAKDAYALLKESGLNFIGNIEGREILSDAADVVVCDGFTGNVILKFAEGFAKTMMGMIKEELTSTFLSKVGAGLAKKAGAFDRMKKRFDYREVGGAPFLGLKSIVIKAHGSSDALAIKNAVRQCIEYCK